MRKIAPKPLISFSTKLAVGVSLLFFTSACGGSSSDDSESVESIPNNSAVAVNNSGGGGSGAGNGSGTGGNQGSIDSGLGGGDNTTSGSGGTGGGNATGNGGGSNSHFDASFQIALPGTSQTTQRKNFTKNVADNSSTTYTTAINVTDVSSFQIISEAQNIALRTDSLKAPNGDIVLSSADSPEKTLAVVSANDVNSLPYPATPITGSIANGTYLQQLTINKNLSAGGSSLSVILLAKKDSNLNSGGLRVNLFFVGEEAQQSTTRIAISGALDVWREIYKQYSISIAFASFDVSSDSGIIPNPAVGSLFYATQAGKTGVLDYAINMYIAESVSKDGTAQNGNLYTDILGISPSIPGPATVTTKSAVAISLLAHQGPDGYLSPDEVRQLGETMAHESGHYLGLFHPVEIKTPVSTFEGDDPLSDTPTCSTLEECKQTGLTTNLMFPVPVGDDKQQTLTSQQSSVIHLQAIID